MTALRYLKLKIDKEKGVSLYLALIIMGAVLALALGISTILVTQMKTTKEIGDSVVAFYAADTGIERALFEDNGISTDIDDFLDFNGNAEKDDDEPGYKVKGLNPGDENCSTEVSFCMKSVGTFKQTQRALLVSF